MGIQLRHLPRKNLRPKFDHPAKDSSTAGRLIDSINSANNKKIVQNLLTMELKSHIVRLTVNYLFSFLFVKPAGNSRHVSAGFSLNKYFLDKRDWRGNSAPDLDNRYPKVSIKCTDVFFLFCSPGLSEFNFNTQSACYHQLISILVLLLCKKLPNQG